VTIVKANGELWVWGLDRASWENDERDRTLVKAWKLSDQVASAVPVGTDTWADGNVFLSVLHEDASLWTWDILFKKNAYGEISPPYIAQAPEKIMEGVSTVMADNPHSSSFWVLKTNQSLWGGWREEIHTTFYIEIKDFNFEKKMDGIHAIWVNPVYNSQIYALRGSGALFAFGENAQGQLGVGFSYGNAKHVYLKHPTRVINSAASVITQSDWSEIYMHTMAIKKDHTLWLWGRDIWFDSSFATDLSALEGSFFSNKPIKVMDNVASAAMGVDHCLVIKQDGSLWVWGYNNAGQLGIGTFEHMRKPVKIMDNVISVTASNRHSLALQADGNLWAWGDNEFGQLGTGDTISRHEPIQIMENVVSIFTTATCNAAVKQDGSVWIWGYTVLHPSHLHLGEEPILKPICILE